MADAHVDDSELGDALFIPMIQADMAGQMMVQGREAKTIKLTAQAPGSFLDLPWEEAVQEFKARGVMTEKGFQELIADYANRSMEARQLMVQHLRERTRELLEKSIAEGLTFRQFAAGFRETAQGLGITAENPAYLQTVFRTNLQTAYGAGRFRAITDDDVMEARPFVQYRTVGDSRVREAHAALDGKVFRSDSTEWRRIAPPNGYNCRCAVITLAPDEAEPFEISDTIPADGQPDPEFEGPPVNLLRQELT